MREQTITRRLAPGFHPSFSIQRQGVTGDLSGDTVILGGDLLYNDVDIIFGPFSARFPAPPHPTRAVGRVLLGAQSYPC